MGTRHFESLKSENIFDAETGEVYSAMVDRKSVFRQTESEPSFVKLYLADLGKLTRIAPKAVQVLFELISMMDYKNEISVSAGKKRDICRKLDIWIRSKGEKKLGTNIVDQYVVRFIKCGLLAKKDKGMYVANPSLFGKGKWGDIKGIKMTVKYDEEGKLIMTEVLKKP